MDQGVQLVSAASDRLAAAMSVNSRGSAAALAGTAGGHTQVTVNMGGIHVPGGFIGNDAQFLSKLAPVIQKAIIQQQDRNSTQQLQRSR